MNREARARIQQVVPRDPICTHKQCEKNGRAIATCRSAVPMPPPFPPSTSIPSVYNPPPPSPTPKRQMSTINSRSRAATYVNANSIYHSTLLDGLLLKVPMSRTIVERKMARQKNRKAYGRTCRLENYRDLSGCF